MELAQRRAQSLVEQGAMSPMDVERLLNRLRTEIENDIEEISPRHNDRQKEQPITPEDVAGILGITIEELFAHFDGGGTLQQLARRHELTVEELVGRMLRQARQRLDRLVEEGDISPEEARRILADLEEEFLQELDHPTPSLVARPEPSIDFEHIPFDFEKVARALSVSPEELHQLLSQERTLEEIAREMGVSLDDLVNLLAAPMEEQLRRLLETGRISDDDAQHLLDKMTEGLLETLTEVHGLREGDAHPDDREFRPAPSLRSYPEIPLTLGDTPRGDADMPIADGDSPHAGGHGSDSWHLRRRDDGAARGCGGHPRVGGGAWPNH